MPGVTVVLVGAALVHLIVGATVGALLMGAKAGHPIPAVLALACPLHAEMR